MIELAIQLRQGAFELELALQAAGPVLGISGPSGSGKSTLLRAAAGLIPARRARVVVGGMLLADGPRGPSLPPERRGLAWVPQEALLFPHLTVAQNLCFAPGATGRLGSDRGAQILDTLGLQTLLGRRTQALSGGERQRVALGRALFAEPRALLLDEPTASLDPELSREVLSLLIGIKQQFGTPMLIATHKAAELLAIADQCAILRQGRIAALGPPLEVLSRPTDLGLARLVGVDNLLGLTVLGHDPSAGLTHLDLGGVVLFAPLCPLETGARAQIGIYAEDLLLCRERPPLISARNVLPATVLALDPIEREFLVRLAIGQSQLLARLTAGAVRDLELQPGTSAFALIKTTACHHLGRAVGA